MIDVQTVTQIIQELAEEIILPRFRRLERTEVSEKGKRDLVTVVDETMETSLTNWLRAYLPRSEVLGEEDAYRNPEKMSLVHNDGYTWIVDPLDGTNNFVQGKREFAVIVALLRNSIPLAAWIHDPLGATTAVAEVGSGAWVSGHRIELGGRGLQDDVVKGSLQSGWENLATLHAPVSPRVTIVPSLYCAAHEYLQLLTEARHFALFIRLMPWDHVAGAFIYRQAGGVAKCFDGLDYKPEDHNKAGIILAQDETAWQSLQSLIFQRNEGSRFG